MSVGPGQRLVSRESSSLQIKPLDDSNNTHCFSELCDVFLSSYGPNSCGKILHNNCGGHVTLTSDSSRLLQSISISNPLLKLMTTSLQDHVRLHADCGSLAAILSSRLILKGLESGLHKRLLIEIYDIALKFCVDFLQSDSCVCKTDVSFKETEMLKKLVKSSWTSKPACLLFGKDLEHICGLTLDTFLRVFSEASSLDTILYVTVDGQSVEKSSLFEGILFESPQIPTYRQRPLSLKFTNGYIAVVLVDLSMAGDSDAYIDVTYETTTDLRLTDCILDKLLSFADHLLHHGIGLLACQKVVHPSVKKKLKENGVLVLDRLGKVYFTALHKLAGGQVVNPFHMSTTADVTSRLSDVTHLVLVDKSYVHLQGAIGSGRPVLTVLLSQRSMEALQETKEVFKTTQHILEMTTRYPEVLPGAGCWQTCLARNIKSKIPSLVHKWIDTLGCSPLHIEQVLQMFAGVLDYVALALDRDQSSYHICDHRTGHHFVLDEVAPLGKQTCGCGAIAYNSISDMEYDDLGQSSMTKVKGSVGQGHVENSRCEIVDAFGPSINALKSAVGISCMVLGIHNYVEDVN